MEIFTKLFVISFIYFLIHSDIFIDYVLRKFDGSIVELGTELTTTGELIRYVIFIVCLIFIEILYTE
jgi:hypothetical protein